MRFVLLQSTTFTKIILVTLIVLQGGPSAAQHIHVHVSLKPPLPKIVPDVIRNATTPQLPSLNPRDEVHQIRTGAATVANAAAAVATPVEAVKVKMQSYVADHVGHAGEVIIDLGSFTENLSVSSGIANANYTAAILDGEDPDAILGAPLAAAIHEAHDRFEGKSMPIPDDVKKELTLRHFDSITLETARYAIGTVEIALPGMVSRAERYFEHQDVAVTVGNIIVFPQDPGTLYRQSCTWWAHELTHVTQYRLQGIEGFALSYSKDILHRKSYTEITEEKNAIANAARITDNGDCNSKEMMSVGRLIYRAHLAQKVVARPDSIRYFNTILKPGEKAIAGCHLSGDSEPTLYEVTSFSRIIAINPVTGGAHVVGVATQPPTPNPKKYKWIFDLRGDDHDYGVFSDGRMEKLQSAVASPGAK